ncbi:MAG: PIF1 family DEAD/DEAH box helicase [Patescibacteria group bacterium]
MTQEQALYILNSGKNVYLTGAAGSGKTYVLNKFISALKKKKIGVGVTASTGIAATHLGGITIHSFAGIGIGKEATEDHIKYIIGKRHVERRLTLNDVLVIDEISMLDAQRLSLVNRVARAARDKEKPFGGMQVVLCGDFFQLPPIQKEGQAPALFAYKSPVWQELNMTVCYLTEQYRQGNDELTEVLNAIRTQKIDDKIKNHLNSRRNAQVGPQNNARLYCHNVDVDAENYRELGKIKDKEEHFYMISRGIPAVAASLKNGCLAPEKLTLKKGASVMFVRNNFDKGYINGTLGRVLGFDKEKYPIVADNSGRKFLASPETWKIEENGKKIASITQIPLRLAWAITVHKSQGMTLDSAEIDLSDAFERGMGYVALSRVKSLSGMRLLGFNDISLQVNEDVLAFDTKLQEASEKAVLEIPPDFLEGKKSDIKIEKKAYSVEEIRKTYASAYMPWTDKEEAKLIVGFKAGLAVVELAKEHGRKIGGIRSRLKKIGLVQEINKLREQA